MEIFCRYIYIFTLILGSCFSHLAEAEESKKLDVGAVLSLSGMASTHGKAIKEGLELAQAELKQQGWEIAIKFEDDQTEPKQTVAAVQRLSLNGIKYFIGPTWGILAEPSRPIIIRNKALSLQPCNSSDFLAGDNSRFFFFFSPPTTALPEIKNS